MKLRHLVETRGQRNLVVMQFGEAQLLETPEGKLIVKGGTKSDHTDVKEYISLFMHEAVVSLVE